VGMKLLLRQTDGLVSYAEKIRRIDLDHFGFPEERTAVISSRCDAA